MNRETRPGVDVKGWLGVLVVVASMWLVMVIRPNWQYFMSNGLKLTMLISAMFLTVIIAMIHVWNQSRSWEDYGDEIRQWQADHDVRIVSEVFKVSFGKAMEVINIHGGGEESEEGEVIGG